MDEARMGSDTLRRGSFSRFTSSGGGGDTSSGSAGGGGGTSSGSAGGGGGTSSLPRFLDGSLKAMHLLRKEKLLDSLLGDRRWWRWDFLGAAVDEVLGWLGFILTRRRTFWQSVTRLKTRVCSGQLLATKIMWSHGDV
jgi:hypothetical protein